MSATNLFLILLWFIWWRFIFRFNDFYLVLAKIIHFMILNHPSSICDSNPTSVLILKRTDIGMKENPKITVQFYLKWFYVLLYLYYKCKTLVFDSQDGNGLQREKIGPTFSGLTPVCRHVIENMNNHLCFMICACRCKTFQRQHLPQILYDCNMNDIFNINKRGELITRCQSLY